MEMTNLNRSLEDYKLNELFELAAWLHREQFPSPVIVQKKKSRSGNARKPAISGEERDHLDGGGQGKKKNSYTNA